MRPVPPPPSFPPIAPAAWPRVWGVVVVVLIGLVLIGLVLGGPAAAQAPSPLERAYSERAGAPLGLIGYGVFAGGADAGPVPPPIGRVPDDLVLGPGDVLSVVLDGDRQGHHRLPVDASGVVAVPDLGVFPAAGRRLDVVRREMADAAAVRAIATEVHVTVAELRRIAVLVGGAVAAPGRVGIGALSGVVDALVAAGGATRSGSLRRVRLIRDGAVEEVDVFALIEGGGADPRLADGDRITVPPIGATAAVAGAVNRPGIFELPADGATVDALMGLAGGALPGAPRLTLYRYDADGRVTARSLGPEGGAAAIADGDLIVAEARPAGAPATVDLVGHVDAPGRVPLAEASDIGTLIDGGLTLRPGVYPLFGAVETTDRASGGRVLLPFSPQAVVDGPGNRALAAGDRVIVLSAEAVGYLGSAGVAAALAGRTPPLGLTAGCPALARLHRAVAAGRGPLAGAMLDAAAALPGVPMACPPAFRRDPDLLTLALAQSVLVTDGAARPGLYPVAEPTPVGELAALAGAAGGRPADARALTGAGTGLARPGDVIVVDAPSVTLDGAVRTPGRRPLAPGAGLADLLADGAMTADDVYPLIAVIERRSAGTLAVERRVVAPAAVLAGDDVALADRDRVRLFTRAEVRALATAETDDDGAAGTNDARAAADRIDPALAAVLDAHAVTVTGAVARPGRWPVAGPTTAEALFEVAGGLLPGARLTDAEATVVGDTGQTGTEVRRVRLDLAARPPAAVVLRPGDALHVPPRRDPVAGRTVAVAGAVRHPGTYTLVEGDRLSSLIDRAGGLTADAYPLGAVFTRESEARARRAWLRERATAIRRALAEAMAGDRPPDGNAVQAVERLLVELETAEPPGRLQIEADPERLRADPSLDIVLQDGDRLVIPVRPLTVRVTGEVLAPAALQFRDGRQVGDYLRGAGGLTRAADTGRVFVVMPDGRAQPVRPSAWTHAPLPIPPGATIVVPRDPAPFRFLDLAGTLGELFGQLALGAAALVTLGE